MVSRDRYELIDFGGGRKLESLAGYLVDRPSPAAVGVPRCDPSRWPAADARYDPRTKQWEFRSPWPDSLQIDCGLFRMPVQPTPYGHIGLFPEQRENWQWLIERARERLLERARERLLGARRGATQQPAAGELTAGEWTAGDAKSARTDVGDGCDPASLWGLNLFGYTGASTLAMVSAGFSVAHVDAAKPNVQACRRAAQHNGWSEAPIRYLVEDAAKFAGREVRRGRRYHIVVLDPPAYGHSPGGRAWRLQRDLWPLLQQCLDLIEDDFALLVTGHSPEVDASDIEGFLRQQPKLRAAWQGAGLNLESGRSQLKDPRGRVLDAGFYLRLWSPSRERPS